VLIEGRRIGHGHAPLIVAEMSGNHDGSLDHALAIVDAVARAGAHAIKLQTYTGHTMTLDERTEGFLVSEESSPWRGEHLFDLYQRAQTPWEWHEPLFRRAREHGLVAFSTAFDPTSVDFLEELGVSLYKIASFEIIDLPLIRRVATTGKPLILSTGMASLAEIDEAVDTAREAGCADLVLMKCTSAYPADPADANLATMRHLRETFRCEVGFSDHTRGIGAAVASAALGAAVIEKHVTTDRSRGGVDAAFSLEPDELALLVAEARSAFGALGRVRYGPTAAERSRLRFRRSLYVTRDLAPGDVLTRDSVRAIRPGDGLHPKYLAVVVGRKVTRAVERGTPVSWDLVS
jgi:pseudaminic acid synthase